MAKKPEVKTEKKIEREYTIPLRKRYQHVPRYKKTPKAIKTIKEFLARHMKVYDRDLNKIKLDKYLNEFVWFRGIKNPPHKIKIKAIKEGDIVKAELVELPGNLKFKKLREEKREKTGEEISKKKKIEKEETPAEEKRTEKEIKEEKEKVKAGEEAGKQIEKAAAKQMKSQTAGKTKQPKRQIRKALEK